jgi:hypothetical protein
MRHLVRAVALLALGAVPASAQSPAPKPSPAAAAVEKQLIGTWEGPYSSEQVPPGSLRLVLTRESAWKAVMSVVSDQPIDAGEVTDFKLEGTTLSWSQIIADMTCHVSAELVNGTIKGESSCEQGGQVAVTASWVLLKK